MKKIKLYTSDLEGGKIIQKQFFDMRTKGLIVIQCILWFVIRRIRFNIKKTKRKINEKNIS